MARDKGLDDELSTVLELLDLPPSAPPPSFAATLGAVGIVGGLVATVPATPTAIAVGTIVMAVGALIAGLGLMPRTRWGNVQQLALRALRNGLPVRETAVTIGGVPSLASLRFDEWLRHANWRIDDALEDVVRRAVRSGVLTESARIGDRWSGWARDADELLAALRELRTATKPGPLRDRLDAVVAHGRSVRGDVHRLVVVGHAAGSGEAARDAAGRVSELLSSLQSAVDATTQTLVTADRTDGIDTARTLRDAANTLLRAHEDLADEDLPRPSTG